MNKHVRKLSVIMLMLFLSVTAVFSQVTTSALSGRVSAEGNEPLPGASVVAVHVPSGTQYGTISNVDGRFNIEGLRPGGPYSVYISFVGYSSESMTGINMFLGETFTLNAALKESAVDVGEVMVVGSRTSVFSSNRTGAQEVFTSDKISKLPTINRSINDFTKLTPMSSNGNFGGTSYRFNNVTVDGASFNNSFGLASSLGARGTEPISLEAIDQIQVMIAPYDVRNGAFTGAGINTVTKSGTNEWHGSAYYYFRSPDLEGRKQKTLTLDKSDFNYNQKGFSVGGPIIKNKLFVFLNGEMDRMETPINWQPSPAPGQQGEGQSIVDVQTLQRFSDFLMEKYEYNPGKYNTSSVPTEADRLTARVDWNINPKNILSVKYFYLKSFNTNMPSGSGATGGSRSPSADRIPFSSSYYRTNNNFNIVMADLVTNINSRLSNTLKIGYSALRDFRDMDGGFFPQVDILNGKGWSYYTGAKSPDYIKGSLIATTVGTEENSYNNKLNSDIWQIQNNLMISAGKHFITIGTQSDLRKFVNGYARSYAGVWEFNSFDAFYKEANDYNTWMAGGKQGTFESLTTKYVKKYSLQPEFPYALVDVLSLGFYAQDRWNVFPSLNLTLGLRADIPIFLTDLLANEPLEAETFQNGTKIDVSQYPKAAPLWSPRLGFNWDVFEDKTFQIRGGTGLFSGTPPYVWLSNQAGNNGRLFADLTKPGTSALLNRGFDGDASYSPGSGTAPRGDIAFTDPDFKYPQLWKTNIALDKKFGNGWIATVEMLYNKDINSIYHLNVALPDDNSANAYKMLGADNRTIYLQSSTSSLANTAVMMKNTSEGYSLYTTLQVQKEFDGELDGLNLTGSYTFGQSKSVTDGSSSVALSAWRFRPAVNPNGEELGYSAGSFPGRLLLTGTYTRSFFNMTTSSFGVVFQRYSPFRYSYTYNGDLNGDRMAENDLVFIPADINQIKLVKDGANDPRTVNEIWAQLDNFIKQDPYLSKNRGTYAERNGGVAPFINKMDLNFTQDFFATFKDGKRNTLRFSFDIMNFGNFLNSNWGVEKTTVLGFQQYQFLKMIDRPSKTAEPTFSFPYVPAGTAGSGSTQTVLSQTFRDYVNPDSRWRMQIGIKYIF